MEITNTTKVELIFQDGRPYWSGTWQQFVGCIDQLELLPAIIAGLSSGRPTPVGGVFIRVAENQ